MEAEDVTSAVAVVMRVPPDAPTTNWTISVPFSRFRTTVGDMLDKGRFPGLIKFDGEAGTPKMVDFKNGLIET